MSFGLDLEKRALGLGVQAYSCNSGGGGVGPAGSQHMASPLGLTVDQSDLRWRSPYTSTVWVATQGWV